MFHSSKACSLALAAVAVLALAAGGAPVAADTTGRGGAAVHGHQGGMHSAMHGMHKGRGMHKGHGRMGVRLQNMTPGLRAFFEAPEAQGVLVAQVRPDSPAARAGLAAGDVIVMAGDAVLERPRDLVRAVAKTEAGETLVLTVLRRGEEKTFEVAPGPRPGRARDMARARGRIGVSVQPLTPGLREFLEAPEAQGVLVAQVRPESPAARAGLAAGDVIVMAGDAVLERPRELVRAVAKTEVGETLVLTVLRRGEEKTFEVRPEAPSADNREMDAEDIGFFHRMVHRGMRGLHRGLHEGDHHRHGRRRHHGHGGHGCSE